MERAVCLTAQCDRSADRGFPVADAGTSGGLDSMIVRATMLGTRQISEVTEKGKRDLNEQELVCGC